MPFPKLDIGERAALALAMSHHADVILMDDRCGVAVAQAHGLTSIGSLGMLDRAASLGVIDFATAVTRLKATNFRYPPDLLDALLSRHHEGNHG